MCYADEQREWRFIIDSQEVPYVGWWLLSLQRNGRLPMEGSAAGGVTVRQAKAKRVTALFFFNKNLFAVGHAYVLCGMRCDYRIGSNCASFPVGLSYLPVTVINLALAVGKVINDRRGGMTVRFVTHARFSG